jgi:putative ABC transport system permease protein
VLAEDFSADALEDLRQRIKGLAPYLEALPTREYVDTTVELRLARGVASLTSLQVLLIGTIGMVNTMLAAVFERTRELAVLRAIGWRKIRVMKLILFESLLLTLVGAVAGTVLALFLMQFLNVFTTAGRLISGELSLEGILHGFTVALVVGVAGGLYPAYRAARLVPTEGLRHE